MRINKALLKYGYSGFKLEILEYCDPSKCIEREQYYIDRLKPEYNISLTACASMTGRNHSEETKKKISVSGAGLGRILSDEAKKRISKAQKGNQYCLGRILSEETKQKISEARKGINHSEETKQKIRESNKGILLGRTRPEGSGRSNVLIEVLDLKTETKTVYPSMSDAARALGTTKASISMYFSKNTKKPFKGRYRFSKV